MNKANIALMTDEERAEYLMASPQRARLAYVKGSKEKMAWAKEYGFEDFRLWNIVGDFYDKNGANRKDSTFTLSGLRELEIIR